MSLAAQRQQYFFTQKLLKVVNVAKKKDVVMECMLSDPRPHVKWYKGDEEILVSQYTTYYRRYTTDNNIMQLVVMQFNQFHDQSNPHIVLSFFLYHVVFTMNIFY